MTDFQVLALIDAAGLAAVSAMVQRGHLVITARRKPQPKPAPKEQP